MCFLYVGNYIHWGNSYENLICSPRLIITWSAMFRNVQLCLSLSLYNIYSRKFSCNFYSCHWHIRQVWCVISLDNGIECLKNAILCQTIVRSNMQHTQTCIKAWGFSVMVNRHFPPFTYDHACLSSPILLASLPSFWYSIFFKKIQEYVQFCIMAHKRNEKLRFHLDELVPLFPKSDLRMHWLLYLFYGLI